MVLVRQVRFVLTALTEHLASSAREGGVKVWRLRLDVIAHIDLTPPPLLSKPSGALPTAAKS